MTDLCRRTCGKFILPCAGAGETPYSGTVFLHILTYGRKISGKEKKKDMKRFGKKAIVFFLAAVFAAAAVVPAFAADKTAVGKIYLTIDGTVGLKDDSENVTVTPYGDNTDRYYVDSIYIENNDGNGYTESNPPKVTVTLSVADEDSYYFSGTASKDFRLTLSDSAKSGWEGGVCEGGEEG